MSSTDKRNLKSKGKKVSSRNYKEYVKRLVENNPHHIDNGNYERKILKIEGCANREIKERIENKLKEDEKELYRAGFVKFIRPKLSDNEYRCFKKLIEINHKIWKLKHEISSYSFSNAKFIKESSFANHEKTRQLKDAITKLQLEEEKILLELEFEAKENTNCLQGEGIDRKLAELESFKLSLKDNQFVRGRDREERRNRCRQSVHASLQKTQIQTQSKKLEFLYLSSLIETISDLQGRKSSRTILDSDHKEDDKKAEKMFNEIKSFLTVKQKTIDQVFSTLTGLYTINASVVAQSHSLRSEQTKRSISSEKNILYFKENDSKNEANSFTKQSQKIEKKSVPSSFKELFRQIQVCLKELKNMDSVKEKNNELAKKLLIVSGDLKRLEIQNQNLKAQGLCIASDAQENESIIKGLEQQIRQQSEICCRLKQQLSSLKLQLEEAHQSLESNRKTQSCSRQKLSLQQDMKLLVDQNERMYRDITSAKEEVRSQQMLIAELTDKACEGCLEAKEKLERSEMVISQKARKQQQLQDEFEYVLTEKVELYNKLRQLEFVRENQLTFHKQIKDKIDLNSQSVNVMVGLDIQTPGQSNGCSVCSVNTALLKETESQLSECIFENNQLKEKCSSLTIEKEHLRLQADSQAESVTKLQGSTLLSQSQSDTESDTSEKGIQTESFQVQIRQVEEQTSSQFFSLCHEVSKCNVLPLNSNSVTNFTQATQTEFFTRSFSKQKNFEIQIKPQKQSSKVKSLCMKNILSVYHKDTFQKKQKETQIGFNYRKLDIQKLQTLQISVQKPQIEIVTDTEELVFEKACQTENDATRCETFGEWIDSIDDTEFIEKNQNFVEEECHQSLFSNEFVQHLTSMASEANNRRDRTALSHHHVYCNQNVRLLGSHEKSMQNQFETIYEEGSGDKNLVGSLYHGFKFPKCDHSYDNPKESASKSTKKRVGAKKSQEDFDLGI